MTKFWWFAPMVIWHLLMIGTWTKPVVPQHDLHVPPSTYILVENSNE